jgi:lysozyme
MIVGQDRQAGPLGGPVALDRWVHPLIAGAAVAIAILLVVALAPTVPAAEAQKRIGIDVSRFQGKINWKQVGQTRVNFAFLQASRGSGRDCSVVASECGPDQTYRRNYRRARANDIIVGPYHRAFTRGTTPQEARRDARREARVFIRSVGRLRDRDLRPTLDFEHPFSGMSSRLLRVWARTWLRVVEREFGVKPIVYTNHSSWQATGDARGFAKRGHPLWVAHWKVPRQSILVPAGNWDGNGWSVWQWTSEGRVAGIRGPVDRNRMRVHFRRLQMGENQP